MASGGAFTDQVLSVVTRAARAGTLGDIIGQAAASADAHKRGGGISIENIRRGVATASIGNLAANITVPSATSGFASLSTVLSLEIFLTGRPLRIEAGFLAEAGGGGVLAVNFKLREALVAATGSSPAPGGYLVAASGTSGMTPWWIEMAPSPGRATVELVADAGTADATIYADANNVAVLAAWEL